MLSTFQSRKFTCRSTSFNADENRCFLSADDSVSLMGAALPRKRGTVFSEKQCSISKFSSLILYLQIFLTSFKHAIDYNFLQIQFSVCFLSLSLTMSIDSLFFAFSCFCFHSSSFYLFQTIVKAVFSPLKR